MDGSRADWSSTTHWTVGSYATILTSSPSHPKPNNSQTLPFSFANERVFGRGVHWILWLLVHSPLIPCDEERLPDQGRPQRHHEPLQRRERDRKRISFIQPIRKHNEEREAARLSWRGPIRKRRVGQQDQEARGPSAVTTHDKPHLTICANLQPTAENEQPPPSFEGYNNARVDP